jgi:hypothetical protein
MHILSIVLATQVEINFIVEMGHSKTTPSKWNGIPSGRTVNLLNKNPHKLSELLFAKNWSRYCNFIVYLK